MPSGLPTVASIYKYAVEYTHTDRASCASSFESRGGGGEGETAYGCRQVPSGLPTVASIYKYMECSVRILLEHPVLVVLNQWLTNVICVIWPMSAVAVLPNIFKYFGRTRGL